MHITITAFLFFPVEFKLFVELLLLVWGVLCDVSELCCGDVTGEATILFPRDFVRFPVIVVGSTAFDCKFVVGVSCDALKKKIWKIWILKLIFYFQINNGNMLGRPILHNDQHK